MLLIQLNEPVGDLGVRSHGRKVPIYVRGMYVLSWLLRRVMKRTTMTTATIKAGTKVVIKAEADVGFYQTSAC